MPIAGPTLWPPTPPIHLTKSGPLSPTPRRYSPLHVTPGEL